MNKLTKKSLANSMKSIGSSLILAAAAGGAASSCAAATFGEDVAFLRRYTEVVVLSDRSGDSLVALVPAYQGRVMTSTSGGDGGLSHGWINRDLIASQKLQQHINVFGGEDRFWLGPEGGQFSIFFAKGVPFEFEHWFTPAAIDTVPYKMVRYNKTSARFEHAFTLTNYSGTVFNLEVRRDVRMLSAKDAWKKIGLTALPSVKMVAFETENKITNAGREPWTKETGLLSIWILGMFNPSPETTIVAPINPGEESIMGKKVTADYFGQVPPDRLVVKENVLFFKGDGKYRSKIGIGPRRSRGMLGSYDAANKVLTLAKYTQPAGETDYVNSLWKLQDNPYGGDVANSYNDGPVSPGAKPLGPFYELESSSPAAALKKGKSMVHMHTTIHLAGSEADLNLISRTTLGVTLSEIVGALPK